LSALVRDGVRIHYETAGRGPALLLTHGFTGSSSLYAKNVAALARANTVITWDIRGHGESDVPSGVHRSACVIDTAALPIADAAAQPATLRTSRRSIATRAWQA
jgi:pimeloyl-ACP methyl ester carboxylesterase